MYKQAHFKDNRKYNRSVRSLKLYTSISYIIELKKAEQKM